MSGPPVLPSANHMIVACNFQSLPNKYRVGKKVCPRLRDPASDCGGELTQPRKKRFWPSLYSIVKSQVRASLRCQWASCMHEDFR